MPVNTEYELAGWLYLWSIICAKMVNTIWRWCTMQMVNAIWKAVYIIRKLHRFLLLYAAVEVDDWETLAPPQNVETTPLQLSLLLLKQQYTHYWESLTPGKRRTPCFCVQGQNIGHVLMCATSCQNQYAQSGASGRTVAIRHLPGSYAIANLRSGVAYRPSSEWWR